MVRLLIRLGFIALLLPTSSFADATKSRANDVNAALPTSQNEPTEDEVAKALWSFLRAQVYGWERMLNEGQKNVTESLSTPETELRQFLARQNGASWAESLSKKVAFVSKTLESLRQYENGAHVGSLDLDPSQLKRVLGELNTTLQRLGTRFAHSQ